jgi:hypothetical protein
MMIKIGAHVIKIGTFMTCCYLYRYIFIPIFTKIGTCVIKIGHIITGIIPCEQAFATFFPPLFVVCHGEGDGEGKGKHTG